MDRSNRRRLMPRLAAELATVFLGVFLAFQAEEWRARRIDSERERMQLRALSDDFVANARRFEADVADQRRVVTAAEWFLAELSRDRSSAPADSIAVQFGDGISWFEAEPVTGAYDALVGSGDIGLIQNGALRRRLAEFYGDVRAGFEDHDNEMQLVTLILEEAKGQLRRLWAPGGEYSYPSSFAAADDAAARELLANEELGGLMTWKVQLSSNRLAWMESLAARSDSIRAMLDEELPGR